LSWIHSSDLQHQRGRVKSVAGTQAMSEKETGRPSTRIELDCRSKLRHVNDIKQPAAASAVSQTVDFQGQLRHHRPSSKEPGLVSPA
jgi:hypothetical protein